MADFRVLLQTVLDKSGINTELKEVQNIINKYTVEILPELKTASLRNQIKIVSKDIANDFNKAFGTNLTGNDIFKAYENQAKQVIEQNKLVEKSFTDLRKGAYQSIGDKSPELKQMAEMYKQEAIEAEKLATERNKLVEKAFVDLRKNEYQSLWDKSPELQKMSEMYKQEAIEAEKLAVSVAKINQTIASGTNEAKVESLTASFRRLGLSTEDTQKELSGVNGALKSLNDSSDNKSLISNAEALKVEYEKVENQINQLTSAQKGFVDEARRLSSANTMTSWLENNSKASKAFGSSIKQMVETLRSADNLTDHELEKINIAFEKIKISSREMGLLGKTWGDSFNDMKSKFASWLTVSGSIMFFVQQLKSSVSELKNINSILTEISKTNDTLSKSDLMKLGGSSFSVASKYGKNASDYLLGVQETSRAGYTNAEEISELSILAQSAGDMTAELSNQYLIATDAAYKLGGQTQKLNEVLDGQNYITNRNAVNMTDLAEATKVAASQANSAQVPIDKMTAAVGTMIATTQQGGDVAGRAFKAILMNIQQISGVVDEESGEIIGEDDLTKYEKAAEALGVKLKEVKDGYLALRDPMQVLKELSKAYTSLPQDDTRRANLINAVGGKFRGNQLNALLENWDKYEKMLSEYSNGSGSAMDEAMKSANNWEGSLNRLSNTITDITGNFVKSDKVIGGLNGLNTLLQGINAVTKALGGLGTISAVGGGILGAKSLGQRNRCGYSWLRGSRSHYCYG